MTMTKRIMVDMSLTILHHGHIRLLQKASKLGNVIVALTRDESILKTKGYKPELSYEERKEILMAIKYVKEVVPCDWLVDNDCLQQHNIDLLVHGDDNVNDIEQDKLVVFPRTEGISSSDMRKRVINSLISINLNQDNDSDKITETLLETIKKYFKMD